MTAVRAVAGAGTRQAHVHESGHDTYPDEQDERCRRAAGHEHGAPPGTRQYTLSGCAAAGQAGRFGRGGGQAADPAGNEVPPVRLELAVLAAGQVLPGPVAYGLARGPGDQVPQVQVGVAGVSRVCVHRFWPFS